MKTKALQEIRNKEIGELHALLKEKRKAFATAKLEQSQFKLKNLRSLTLIRQEVAVILTIMREKELAALSQEK